MQKENSNSGIFIKIPLEPREEWMPVNYGYECQIDNKPELSKEDDYHYTGTLYSLTKPLAKPGRPGKEWNTTEITIDGPRVIVFVNGVKVTDFREGDPGNSISNLSEAQGRIQDISACRTMGRKMWYISARWK
jgi:hypothetical protein